jgi:hypothetical protein
LILLFVEASLVFSISRAVRDNVVKVKFVACKSKICCL